MNRRRASTTRNLNANFKNKEDNQNQSQSSKYNGSANLLSDPERKEAANDFLMAYKIRALDQLVEHKSFQNPSLMDDDMDDDVYLDKDQKAILQKTKCLIRSNSKMKTRWDLVIMIMSIFNCFAIPYQVSFKPRAMNELYFRLLNAIIDLWFIVDVVVNFRTSYIHPKTGNEILHPKTIAKDYLKGRFWIDFLASAPFDWIGEFILGAENVTTLRLFSLFKLVRVLRLNRIITVMKVDDEVKLSLKLMKLVFFLIMYLHWIAWSWHYIVDINERWIPPLDYVYITTDFYKENNFFRYWSSMYHSVLMLTGNDLGPRGELQIIFVAMAVAWGAIVNANIFGELAVILSNLNRKSTLFQAKLDIANTAMKTLSLPDKLQVKVTGFLTYSRALLESQEELQWFLQMLSPSLKEKVLKQIFIDTLKRNSLFLNNEGMLDYVTRKLDTRILLPEFNIVNQGEKGSCLYFIAKGEWGVFINDHKGIKHRNEENLMPGDLFGEVALLWKCNRTATVKTTMYSTIANLNKTDFDTISRIFNGFQSTLKMRMKRYQDTLKQFMKQLFLNVDYFKKWGPDTLEEITYYCEQEHFEKDRIIFRAGDPIDKIFFIISGKIDITINITDIDVVVDSLYQGCSIGWNGILGDFSHNFTARSTTNCSAYTITKDSLKSLVNICEDLDKEVYTWK